MAVTQNTYTGNGSQTSFSFTFPYLETTDIKVSVNNVVQTLTTHYTLPNATTVQFVSAPANGAAIRIYRTTNSNALQASFYPGSAIRAADLNENFYQSLYIGQESSRDSTDAVSQVNQKVAKTGDSMTGSLAMGGNPITDLAAPSAANDAARKAYVDSYVAQTANIADSAVTTAKLADSSVSTLKLANNSVTSSRLAANSVTSTQLAAASVTRIAITANAVGTTELSDYSVTNAKLDNNCVDNTKIQNGVITGNKLASAAVTGSNIALDTITDSNISTLAAIAKTKISGTAITAADTGTVTSAMIADGTIVNGDVNSAAAIAGTKVSPDFGSQNITTTGNITANAQGDVRFGDADSSNWVALQAPAIVPANITWTLPSADGSSGQLLSTNGSGTLSWATVSGGGGGGSSISVLDTSAVVSDTGANGTFTVTTDGVERLRVDNIGYAQNAVNGLAAGRLPSLQYYRLDTSRTGSTTSGSLQSFLGVGVTLIGSTVYEFEGNFILTRVSGTNAGILSLGFGGTATINNIGYTAFGIAGSNANFNNTNVFSGYSTSASATSTGSTIGNITNIVYMKGTVSINAGGTFIPSYQLGSSPSVAFDTAVGSYFSIFPLSASGSATSIGSWV